MKSLDNTIKYYELLMTYDDTSKYLKYGLPEGYHFEFYQDGDMMDWIQIHIESGEFTSIPEGERIFHEFYDSFLDELDRRCFFLVEDSTGERIGAATVSLLKEKEFGYDATVDWVAIKKSFQGKGLSKGLISKIIQVANDLGHEKILLHTQTTTWLAAKLYLDFGFVPFHTDDVDGWNIIKTLTKHPKLEAFETVRDEDIYDTRNVEIERQLNEIYPTDYFHYSVWYKNGLHNVYVYCDGNSYEYEYFEENGKIRLEKIK